MFEAVELILCCFVHLEPLKMLYLLIPCEGLNIEWPTMYLDTFFVVN